MNSVVDYICGGKKRYIGILMTAVILAAALLSGFTTVKKPEDSSIQNLSLTVSNSNVIVKISETGEFKYEIDETIYKLTATQNGSTFSIDLKLTGKPKKGMNMATVFLPNQQYDKVTVMGNHAGIKLPALNADLDITNNGGAVSLNVPQEFDKNMDVSFVNGAGALNLSLLADDYTVNIKQKKSAVGVPAEFPSYMARPEYQYVKGNGKAKINLDLQSSAFSIRTSNKLFSQIPALTAGEQRYGPFQLKKGDVWTPDIIWSGQGSVYAALQSTDNGDSFRSGQFQQRLESGDAFNAMTVQKDGEYWLFVGTKNDLSVENIQVSISFRGENEVEPVEINSVDLFTKWK